MVDMVNLGFQVFKQHVHTMQSPASRSNHAPLPGRTCLKATDGSVVILEVS